MVLAVTNPAYEVGNETLTPPLIAFKKLCCTGPVNVAETLPDTVCNKACSTLLVLIEPLTVDAAIFLIPVLEIDPFTLLACTTAFAGTLIT